MREVRHGFALRAMSLRDGIPLPYSDSLRRIMSSSVKLSVASTVNGSNGTLRALYHEDISPHAARRSERLREVRHGFALRAMSLRDGIPLLYIDSLCRIMQSSVKLSVVSTVV